MSVYECRMPHCRDEVYTAKDVCEACWAYRLHHLRRLPWMYVRVYAQLEPGHREIDIDHINVVNPEPGVPVNLSALDALQFAYDKCSSWAAYLASTYGRPYRSHDHTTGRAFVNAVQYLIECDSRFATGFYAADYVEDIYVVFRRLVNLAAPAPTRVIPNPCPHCDAMTVVSRNADEYAACLTCGCTWAHSRIPNLHNLDTGVSS